MHRYGTANPSYRHGHALRDSTSGEYRIWQAMKNRCRNRNQPHWDSYGGRGIVVCDAWRNSFEAFYQDMGPRPTSRHTIDRIDNDGDYSPGNCRWATYSEQANNRRPRRDRALLSHQGLTLSQAAWSRRLGINQATLQYRLANGWSVEDALNTSPSQANRAHRR